MATLTQHCCSELLQWNINLQLPVFMQLRLGCSFKYLVLNTASYNVVSRGIPLKMHITQ